MKAADASTLGGLPASAYALATAQTAPGAAAAAGPDTSSTVTTPGGTSGYLPVFSGGATIDDSLLFEDGTGVGIGTKTPAAKLDVDGSADVRGALGLLNTAEATASAGANSQPLDFFPSVYDSSTKKAETPQFQLQAEPAGNDSTAPGGTLNLLYGNGAKPAETGFSINAEGVVTFAKSQTFPGAGEGSITGVTTTSPLTGSGTAGSVALGLNISALETALNSSYAQLGAADTFTHPITFASGQTFPGVATLSAANNFTNSGTFNVTSSGYALFAGNGSETAGDALAAIGYTAVDALGYQTGVKGSSTASGGTGVYGTTQSGGGIGVQAGATTGTGLSATATSGTAISGSATSGAAVYGAATSGTAAVLFASPTESASVYISNNAAADKSGVVPYGVQAFGGVGVGEYGQTNSQSSTGSGFYNSSAIAGLWGDAGDGGLGGVVVGVLGTTDDHVAGAFYSNTSVNHSSELATLYAENDTTAYGYLFITYAPHSAAYCDIDTTGTSICSGPYTNEVKAGSDAHRVQTYSMQEAENWIEDAGSTQLVNGAAHVTLEPVFGQTVNTAVEYHVFLTPDDDCRGLYVSAKSPEGFDVHELGGGKSSIPFEYRIMAKRTGYEAARLVDVTGRIEELKAQHPPLKPGNVRLHAPSPRPPAPPTLLPSRLQGPPPIKAARLP